MTAEERSDKLLKFVERIAIALEKIAGSEPPLKHSLGRKLAYSDPDPAAVPNCPDCAIKMIPRVRKADGYKFWGCPNFPACKKTIDIPTTEPF
jgi:hypothetical protein